MIFIQPPCLPAWVHQNGATYFRDVLGEWHKEGSEGYMTNPAAMDFHNWLYDWWVACSNSYSLSVFMDWCLAQRGD